MPCPVATWSSFPYAGLVVTFLISYGMSSSSKKPMTAADASPQVQAQAKFVILSNEEDGFAHALEKFILPRATSPSN